jgi:hypothetical protein
MFRWISIFGGLLIMMGHHARAEALFYYFLSTEFPRSRVRTPVLTGAYHQQKTFLSRVSGVSSGVTSLGALLHSAASMCRTRMQRNVVNIGDCAWLRPRALCCDCARMDFKSRASASFATRAGKKLLKILHQFTVRMLVEGVTVTETDPLGIGSFILRAASRRSASLTMLYRSKTDCVRWPLMVTATCSGIPRRTMERTPSCANREKLLLHIGAHALPR